MIFSPLYHRIDVAAILWYNERKADNPPNGEIHHVKTTFRRFRQRKDHPAVPAHPRPGRGGRQEHPAGAGTVHLVHRGPHPPGAGRRAERAGGELFLHQPRRAHPVGGGRLRRPDPQRCGPGRAGPPRPRGIAGQRPLLLSPPPLCRLLPDGCGDHRRAEERGPLGPAALCAGAGVRRRQRKAQRAGPHLSGLRDPAGRDGHGPLRPPHAGCVPPRERPCPGRTAGVSARPGGVHRRVRHLQRPEKAADGCAAGLSAHRDGGSLRRRCPPHPGGYEPFLGGKAGGGTAAPAGPPERHRGGRAGAAAPGCAPRRCPRPRGSGPAAGVGPVRPAPGLPGNKALRRPQPGGGSPGCCCGHPPPHAAGRPLRQGRRGLPRHCKVPRCRPVRVPDGGHPPLLRRADHP